MAASASDIIKNLTIHLAPELKIKWASLLPILAEVNDLVQEFNKDDVPTRSKCGERAKQYMGFFAETLGDKIAERNKQIAPITPNASLSKNDLQTKQEILRYMNESATMTCNLLRDLKFSLEHADMGIGACQELTTVSMALLMVLYGTGKSRQLDLELIQMFAGYKSHVLVVINRNPESSIKNVKDWGKDCLVFDPFLKILYSPTTIPSYCVLSAFLNPFVPPVYTIDTNQSNHLALPRLDRWLEHDEFGMFVAETQKTIQYFCEEYLLSMLHTRMCNHDAPVEKPGVFASMMRTKPSLIEYLEKVSGLSFIGIKTKDWSTHHFAFLPTKHAESKAMELQQCLPGCGFITSLSGVGKVLFFHNTNNSEGKALQDAVLGEMRKEQTAP